MPRAMTPRRVNRRDQGPRTCHQRKTTQRFVVSHVKSMCLGQSPKKGYHRALGGHVMMTVVHDGTLIYQSFGSKSTFPFRTQLYQTGSPLHQTTLCYLLLVDVSRLIFSKLRLVLASALMTVFVANPRFIVTREMKLPLDLHTCAKGSRL
jgi:hypothetical protein